MRMWSQVGMRAVGTGSSGWVQLTANSVKGSGLNWSCCCCACCPFHFRSETPPSPYTEAGRAPHPQAGCDPTREAPRTGWNFLLRLILHSHYCCYCCQFHFHSSWSTLPGSPHQGPVCLFLLHPAGSLNAGLPSWDAAGGTWDLSWSSDAPLWGSLQAEYNFQTAGLRQLGGRGLEAGRAAWTSLTRRGRRETPGALEEAWRAGAPTNRTCLLKAVTHC